ncbi:MAG TPA: hypothetical protein VEU09_01305 [Candidatus Binatia bacterium]|nr:hypothetical protein [Candidatus Binatia bacterium]
MIHVAPMIREVARSDRGSRPRGVALVAPGAAADAVAVGMLLLGPPIPQPLGSLAPAVFHGMAVLLLYAGVAGARPSRRFLCVSAVLAVPLLGAAVALATLVTRGRDSAAPGLRMRRRRRQALTAAAILSLADALSNWDALECGDEEERRGALSRLSRRRDPEAIALLRRAATDRDPTLALSAALVLDEIGERAEREASWLLLADIRHEAV